MITQVGVHLRRNCHETQANQMLKLSKNGNICCLFSYMERNRICCPVDIFCDFDGSTKSNCKISHKCLIKVLSLKGLFIFSWIWSSKKWAAGADMIRALRFKERTRGKHLLDSRECNFLRTAPLELPTMNYRHRLKLKSERHFQGPIMSWMTFCR